MFWTPQQVPILVVIVYRWDESGSEPRLVKDLLYVITQDSKHHARVGPSFWQCSNLQNRRPHVCGHNQPLFTTSLQHTQEHQQTRTQWRRSCNLQNKRPHVCFTVSHYSQPECALVTRQVVNSARQKMLTEYGTRWRENGQSTFTSLWTDALRSSRGPLPSRTLRTAKLSSGIFARATFTRFLTQRGPKTPLGPTSSKRSKRLC